MWREEEEEERKFTSFAACIISGCICTHFIFMMLAHLSLETELWHFEVFYEGVRMQNCLSFIDGASVKPTIYRNTLY